MNHFKFRAECVGDVMNLMNILIFKTIMVTIDDNQLDCTVEVVTRQSLEEVMFAMNHTPDCHVMVETVKPIDEYTGVRE